MKITIVCDNIVSDSFHESLALGLAELGHEVVTVCFDGCCADKEGCITIPDIRPVGSEALENAVWDSDAVLISVPSRLGLAAIRLCSAHCIPYAAEFSRQGELTGFRRYVRHDPHSVMMSLRHVYKWYLQDADAVIYRSYADKRVFELSADTADNSYVIPEKKNDSAAERYADVLEAIHI